MESLSGNAKRLLRAWLLLVGLTLASLGTVLGFEASAGLFAAAVALAASFWKARLVLDQFLDLRHAPSTWRGFFYGMLLVILCGLMGSYAWVAFGT